MCDPMNPFVVFVVVVVVVVVVVAAASRVQNQAFYCFQHPKEVLSQQCWTLVFIWKLEIGEVSPSNDQL